MEIYRIDSQINEEARVYDPKEYESFPAAESVMRSMIAKQGKKMNIESYISTIRKGNNPEYRAMIADTLENIFSDTAPLSAEKIMLMKEAIEDFNLDCRFGEKKPVDNFRAKIEGRIISLDFLFDQRLHFEFDVKSDATDGSVIYSYLYIKDRSGKLEINVDIDIKDDVPKKRSNSASILLVYKKLIDDALEVKKAIEQDHMHPNSVLRGITPEKISKACAGLSEETIIKQIKTLEKLGIPIKLYKVSKEEKEFWAVRHLKCNEGYEIDLDFLDKVPEPIDASEFGIHVNPLLILFVLKTSNKPMRQADIIKVIQKKYTVNIKRKTVARHIELLVKNFNYPISKSKNGYIWEKQK